MIDRVFVFANWLSLFPNALVRNLQIKTSNHAPILLNLYAYTTPLLSLLDVLLPGVEIHLA